MSDGSKRVHSQDKRSAKTGAKYRFLPQVELPPDLPPGSIAIAEMANAFGVTHRTLHFYEEKGLIAADRFGLMRVYSHQNMLQMAVINTCREVGMPVAVIQELMEELQRATSQEQVDTIFRGALLVRKRELMSGLSTVRRQMQQIANLLDQDTGEPLPPINDNRHENSLSETEQKCLELMAEGHMPAKLARVMEMPQAEIEAMEASIIRKFNSSNRFQAIAKAVLLGIVPS